MIISRKKKVARPVTETEEAEAKGKTRHLEKAGSIIKEDARAETVPALMMPLGRPVS